MSKITNYITHVALVLDASSSMLSLKNSVIKVVDQQISYLARRSKELSQDVRVSVYVFSDTVSCVVYDRDVLRLPSIASLYAPRGNTALIDASIKSIEDLKKTPELYGDHSHLILAITDGEQNAGVERDPNVLKKLINGLSDNWTVGILVPNQRGAFEAKACGFPASNIQIWDANNSDFNEAGEVITKSIDSYLVARSSGVRSTKNLFSIDKSALTTTAIKNNLSTLTPGKDYEIYPVRTDAVIKPFVESWTQEPYRLGSAYYQLTKPEKIQASKNILIQDKLSGRVYSGADARQTLGLPNYEVKVNAVDHPKFRIYVNSTSTNRKLVKDTMVIVLK